MTLRAVSLDGVVVSAEASSEVLSMGDRTQMFWIDARSITTDMVDLQTSGDRSLRKLVTESM